MFPSIRIVLRILSMFSEYVSLNKDSFEDIEYVSLVMTTTIMWVLRILSMFP